jgi:hypothetical protein
VYGMLTRLESRGIGSDQVNNSTLVIVIVYLFHRSFWLVPLDVEHVEKHKQLIIQNSVTYIFI